MHKLIWLLINNILTEENNANNRCDRLSLPMTTQAFYFFEGTTES